MLGSERNRFFKVKSSESVLFVLNCTLEWTWDIFQAALLHEPVDQRIVQHVT